MTDLERMAYEAGFTTSTGWRDDDSTCEYFEAWPEQLERLAALIRADEREKCAVKVENFPHWFCKTGRAKLAAAIRAGSE